MDTYNPDINLSSAVLRCPYSQCNARIITPKCNVVKRIETGIPFIKVGEDVSTDAITDNFIIVDDVWDFDNIGVSKPTDQFVESGVKVERLIICSECDRGPLGFAFFDNDDEKDVKKLKYAVHLDSFVYDLKQ
ncbi:unnamed protein product [Cyberlindnera jadinii]|uniref:Mss4-like protein n=1 Tax=Cyberlindnera jadinii (strain ATCC 18201 / CBS 1600 / BCRC 20928 / JCM 3617 / NBRC 0987 / NRRL Y-1542) TaxID=983966 RepID=A0A0H5BZY6_CYBJN|nr:Mss4-like protein [Cyberlindnera jadinii NRRL Y-1542]ODV76462.1 Mss4-like protein [Cyberlindnera jadinii NRRL Y-1542]CEP21090.1 unnamed protein product [Cyberlindnera jadinii]